MSATVWSDPPPIGGPLDPRSVWMERLRPVKLNPGAWAMVKAGTPSACHGAAQQLRLRQLHVPPGDWDFTVRTFRRGVHVGDHYVAQLYARYNGPGQNLPYQISAYAIWDEQGRRLCEDCLAVLERPSGGSWPKKCGDCWARIADEPQPSNQRKWARRLRARISASGETTPQ